MKKNIFIILILGLILNIKFVSAATTGTVNVNDSLTLRNAPTTSGSYITSLYNNSVVTILDLNAGSGNGCPNKWYKISYGNYTGYSCGTYIVVNQSQTSNQVSNGDNSYSRANYNNLPAKDGTIMCYEDTGNLNLRSSAAGSTTGKQVKCGQAVTIKGITETSSNTSCKYWYNINDGTNSGYVCGYFVNTTKLSQTAQNYYNKKTNGDTTDSYKSKLKNTGFPDSYLTYLLEIHARHPNWNFTAEKINLNFDDVVNGEAINGRNLLQKSAFDVGYLSTASFAYNVLNDKFIEYSSEPGYYNASNEAIAYYLDPRNYLNEKYIFAFETLEYSSNQTSSVVSNLLSGQTFWNTVYNYYNKSGAIKDSSGSVSSDIVNASSKVGISAVHVASRIKQEITGLSANDSRLGGSFTYNGKSYSGYYNFYNIKSSCSNCSSIYSAYSYDKGWNTPYKGLYGGAKLLHEGYIAINQDTNYYEKFDVSTTNGNYTHQYMQNLAATVQESGSTFKSYSSSLASYLNSSIKFVIPVYNNMPTYSVTAPTLGNPNNYLKGLTVNGSSVSNFNYATQNYNVNLSANTTSVTIGATKINSAAQVSGTGSIKINSNTQTNNITVTSQNGKTRTYTITFKKPSSNSNATSATTISNAMNNSGYKYNNTYVYGIDVGTPVTKIVGNITSYNSYNSVSVKDINGNNKTSGSFKTGDKVVVSGSDGTKTYSVIIYGDINGDGLVDKKDLLTVQSKVFGYSNLSGIYNKAADVNKDGLVDKKDLLTVQSHVFGYSKISQK